MKVNDEPAKHRILSALSDEYSRHILTATINQPYSALELSKNLNIPVTTVYRRIEEMVDSGLIAIVRSGRTNDGKWYGLYRSLLLRIDVSFDYGEMTVNVTLNDQIADKFTRLWTGVSRI